MTWCEQGPGRPGRCRSLVVARAQTEAGRPLVGMQQEELLHRWEVRLRELRGPRGSPRFGL